MPMAAADIESAIVAAFVEHGYTCSRDDTLLLRAYDRSSLQ